MSLENYTWDCMHITLYFYTWVIFQGKEERMEYKTSLGLFQLEVTVYRKYKSSANRVFSIKTSTRHF